MIERKGSLLIPLDDGNKNLTNLILTDVLFAGTSVNSYLIIFV